MRKIKNCVLKVGKSDMFRRHNRPYIEVYAAMKESGALQYMVDCYEPLHTQSREYVDDSILEFIHNRNISI